MTYVVATINLKGGVGKTTTTAALAEMMSGEFGQRVLLVDLDPQTNLTMMMIGERRWGELDARNLTLASLFERAASAAGSDFHFDISTIIERAVSPLRKVSTVDLVPSSLRLIGLQEKIGASGDATGVLLRALKPVLDQYDYILIDCRLISRRSR